MTTSWEQEPPRIEDGVYTYLGTPGWGLQAWGDTPWGSSSSPSTYTIANWTREAPEE